MEVFPLKLQLYRLGSFLGIQDLMLRENLQTLSQFPVFTVPSIKPVARLNLTGSFLQLIICTPSDIQVYKYIPQGIADPQMHTGQDESES